MQHNTINGAEHEKTSPMQIIVMTIINQIENVQRTEKALYNAVNKLRIILEPTDEKAKVSADQPPIHNPDFISTMEHKISILNYHNLRVEMLTAMLNDIV